VDDVARAILMALESDIPYEEPILNIASGMSISVEEVVQKVINILGVNLSKYVIFEPEEDGQNNAEYYSVENKLAFKSLGWKPDVNFEVGLAQYIEWSSKEMTRFSQS
jgi:nucleoside-diphosphate-sugar epimerase